MLGVGDIRLPEALGEQALWGLRVQRGRCTGPIHTALYEDVQELPCKSNKAVDLPSFDLISFDFI